MLNIIVAFDQNRLIGNKNEIPWHIPSDMRYFKQTTLNHPVVMGRNTFRSIGKPLPNRENIVLSKDKALHLQGVQVHSDWDEILIRAKNETIFIIGGSKVYEQAIDMVDQMYITRIHHSFEGDSYFPKINEEDWKITQQISISKNESEPYRYDFEVWKRR